MNEFTIELTSIIGRCEIHHSYTNSLPKSAEHSVSENTNTGFDMNFIDRDPPPTLPPPETTEDDTTIKEAKYNDLVARAEQNQAVRNTQTVYYHITKPQQTSNQILYFSVKGLDDENHFQLTIYNQTVNNANRVKVSLIFTTVIVFLRYFYTFIF